MQLEEAQALPDDSVDPRTLVERQIRLYIETSPILHVVVVGAGVALAAAVLWLLAPEQRPTVALWAALVQGALLARIVAWLAYSRVRPGESAVARWLKWFVWPHACSMMLIGAAPLLFVPSSGGRDMEILLATAGLVYVVAIGSALKLSAYRPAAPIVLGPMLLVYLGAMLRLPGAAPALLAAGGVVAVLWGAFMSKSFNDAIVRAIELSIRNQNLATALARRGERLREQTLVAEEARRAAERAELDKTRFLAAASHDLRQPMHAISLMVGMLRPRTSAAEREVVERLERSVEIMDNLFGTILDLSKLDSGAVTPVVLEVPLHRVFESVETHFAPQAASKKLVLLSSGWRGCSDLR